MAARKLCTSEAERLSTYFDVSCISPPIIYIYKPEEFNGKNAIIESKGNFTIPFQLEFH